MGFYEWFVEQCAKKGESVAEAARAVGVSPASANGWKNGSAPKDTTLYRIEQYFGEKYVQNKEETLQTLLDDERALLKSYRTMTDEQKKIMMVFIRGLKND